MAGLFFGRTGSHGAPAALGGGASTQGNPTRGLPLTLFTPDPPVDGLGATAWYVDGSTDITITISGDIFKDQDIDGSTSITVGTSGDIVDIPGSTNWNVDGTIVITDVTSGAVIRDQKASGSTTVTDTTTGVIIRDQKLSGNTAETIATSGAATVARQIGNHLSIVPSYNSNNHIYSLDDGLTWTAGTNPSSGITHFDSSNDTFMGIGGNNVYVTRNGTNWVTLSTPFSSSFIKHIAYGNGVWMILHQTGYASTSSDNGVTWSTPVAVPNPGTVTQYDDFVYGNGIFLIFCSANNSVYRSSDNGVTWNTYSLGRVNGWQLGTYEPYSKHIIYAFGKFIYGENPASTAGSIVWVDSLDGITWTAHTTMPTYAPNGYSGNWSSVAYSNGRLIYISSDNFALGNYVAISENGTDWYGGTNAPLSASDINISAVYGGFIATDGSGNAYFTSDGLTWISLTLTAHNWAGGSTNTRFQEITATTSGSILRNVFVGGSTPETVSTSGDVKLTRYLDGNTPEIVSTTGTVQHDIKDSGFTNITISASGDITVDKKLDGATGISVTTNGDISVSTLDSGATTITVGTYGAIDAHLNADGTTSILGTFDGTIFANYTEAGADTDITVTAYGDIQLDATADGSTDITVSADGTLRREQSTTGSLSIIVAPAGDIKADKKIDGALGVTISTDGTIHLETFTSGNTPIVANTTGALRLDTYVDGSRPVVANTSGAISRHTDAQASTDITVVTSGSIRLGKKIDGTTTETVTTDGAIRRRVNPQGSTTIAVSTTGDLHRETFLQGDRAETASTTGSIIKGRKSSGSTDIVITTSGSIRKANPITDHDIVVTASLQGGEWVIILESNKWFAGQTQPIARRVSLDSNKKTSVTLNGKNGTYTLEKPQWKVTQ